MTIPTENVGSLPRLATLQNLIAGYAMALASSAMGSCSAHKTPRAGTRPSAWRSPGCRLSP